MCFSSPNIPPAPDTSALLAQQAAAADKAATDARVAKANRGVGAQLINPSTGFLGVDSKLGAQ